MMMMMMMMMRWWCYLVVCVYCQLLQHSPADCTDRECSRVAAVKGWLAVTRCYICKLNTFIYFTIARCYNNPADNVQWWSWKFYYDVKVIFTLLYDVIYTGNLYVTLVDFLHNICFCRLKAYFFRVCIVVRLIEFQCISFAGGDTRSSGLL